MKKTWTRLRNRSKRRWRFRGICRDAKALGVDRSTLYRLLVGDWKSRSLMARYAALREQYAAIEQSTPN